MIKNELDIGFLLIPDIINNLINFNIEISSKMENKEVYDSILEYGVKLFSEIKIGILFTIDAETKKLNLWSSKGIDQKNIKKTSMIFNNNIRDEIYKKGLVQLNYGEKGFSNIIYKNILIEKQIKSVIYLPIRFEDSYYCILQLYLNSSEPFQLTFKSILNIFTKQSATAIHNVKQYQNLIDIAENKTKQFITLREITESLSQRKSLKDILYLITKESLNIVGHGKKVAFIMLMDKEKNILETKAAYGELFRKEHLEFHIQLSKRSIVTWVARNAKPRIATNVFKDKQYENITPETKAEICIPLIFRDEVIGVLDIESSELSAFDEQDKELLQTLAENTSVAIKIAELYDIRIKQLEALYKTGTKISSSLNINEVLRTISEEALNAIGPQNRTLYVQLLNEKDNNVDIKVVSGANYNHGYVGKQISKGDGISGYVLRKQKYYLCSNVKNDPYYLEIDPQVKSELCVPIKFGERVIGLINVESFELNDFGAHEIQLLEGLANQACVAIENARLNKGLANTQFELTQALEIAIIGETLAGLSHDIRSSYSLISGETQWLDRLLIEDKLSQNEVKKAIKKIESYVERIERLTEDLTKRSQQQPPILMTANLIDIIKECLCLLSGRIDRCLINVEEDYSSNNIKTEIDINRLKRVFINIIMNAIDVMPNGGSLKIKIYKDEKNIKLSFADSGIGISKENLKRIWEKFFTTKINGSGLGLAICKRIIEFDHKGKIEIKSEKYVGTTVHVTLPTIQTNIIQEKGE